ncbi:hypothetical protein FRC08_004294 [Ceratobasidium sp. 394]|nr:hypothetical protein FRC08_004294 [Ceratobasidium sp. 394]
MTEDLAPSPPVDLQPLREPISTAIAPQSPGGTPQPTTLGLQTSPNLLDSPLSDDASPAPLCTAVTETVATATESSSEAGARARSIRNTTPDQAPSEEGPCAENTKGGASEAHNDLVAPLAPAGAPYTTTVRLETPPSEITPGREPPPTYSASPLFPAMASPLVPPPRLTSRFGKTVQNGNSDNGRALCTNPAGQRLRSSQMGEGTSRSHDSPSVLQPNTVGMPGSGLQITAASDPNVLFSASRGVDYAAWGGLHRFAQVLTQSGMNAFAPLKLAVHDMFACIDIFERAAVSQGEYSILRTQLDSLFHDLAGYLGGSTPPTMTLCIENLAMGINQEIAHIREKGCRRLKD